jgi:cell division protein FtsW (lipid II flippase)
MSVKDWTVLVVFIALHLAVALIRGVPIHVLFFGSIAVMFAATIIILPHARQRIGFKFSD